MPQQLAALGGGQMKELYTSIEPVGSYVVVKVGTAQTSVANMRQAKAIVDAAKYAYRLGVMDAREHVREAIGLEQ